MDSFAIILIVIPAFFTGVFSLFGYMLWRMMRNDGWDKSNITNAQRLLSHVVLHSEDFGQMYYLDPEQVKLLLLARKQYDPELKRPFWYVVEDEFDGVVKTRPSG